MAKNKTGCACAERLDELEALARQLRDALRNVEPDSDQDVGAWKKYVRKTDAALVEASRVLGD